MSERPRYSELFVDAMRELEVSLRAESKETLLLFLAAEIARKSIVDAAIDRDAIARELQALRDWRKSARTNNIIKRLEGLKARIASGKFPKRRRRRRARTRTVTIGL